MWWKNYDLQAIAQHLCDPECLRSMKKAAAKCDIDQTTFRKARDGFDINPEPADELLKAGFEHLGNHIMRQCRRVVDPLYDPNTCSTFEEWLRQSPNYDLRQLPTPSDLPICPQDIWGHKLDSPFGAAAAPWTADGRYISLLASAGFSVITHKTVRTIPTKAHELPRGNLAYITAPPDIMVSIDPKHLPKSMFGTRDWHKLTPLHKYLIANCFGMPSPRMEDWQRDVAQTVENLTRHGKLLVLSVVGTVPEQDAFGNRIEDKGGDRLVTDFAKCVQSALEIKDHFPPVIELNLSCPHAVGEEGIVFTHPTLAGRVCETARAVINDSAKPVRLLAKIGWLPKKNGSLDITKLKRLFEATVEYLDGYSAINTVPIEIWNNETGRTVPFFDCEGRFVKAGVSGVAIQQCALSTIKALRNEIERAGVQHDERVIFGMGGVDHPTDVKRFIDEGATIVQAAKAVNHDVWFAARVRQHLANWNRTTIEIHEELNNFYDATKDQVESFPAQHQTALIRLLNRTQKTVAEEYRQSLTRPKHAANE